MTSGAGTSPGRRLRELIDAQGHVLSVGAPDPFAAKVAEARGVASVYVSGMVAEATLLGAPDIGLMTLTEFSERAYRIADAVSLPVISDADIGFVGGAANVRRTVHELEHSGVAAIHLEDQALPKRCPLFPGKRILDRRDAVARIDTAVRARRDPDFVLIARTDADDDLQELTERAKMYLDAGADFAMPMISQINGASFYAQSGDDQMEVLDKVAQDIQGPLAWACNRLPGGYTSDDLARLGYSIVISATVAFHAYAGILDELYRSFVEDGAGERFFAADPPEADGIEVMRTMGIDLFLDLQERADSLQVDAPR